MSETKALERFTRFIADFADEAGLRKYERLLSECAAKGSRQFVVDMTDLYVHDPVLFDEIVANPERVIPDLNCELSSQLRTRGGGEAKLGFRKMPAETSLREVGAEGLWKLIQVRGLVTRMSAITPYAIRMAFKCEKCGDTTFRDVRLQDTPKPPVTCSFKKCYGKSFSIIPEQCVSVSSQRVTLQENPEELPAGQIQRILQCFLSGNLVDSVRPGDHVSMVGVLKAVRLKGFGSFSPQQEFLMEGLNVESEGEEDDLEELSPEDEEAIAKISQDPDLLKNLILSFDTWIYGMAPIKEALLYQLVGGVEKHNEKSKTRGEINILLVGDSGTGKSQLLIYQTKMARRGIYTMGVASSGVGLTASVSKDQVTGIYTVDAGAMVLADRGICAIDEIDKMNDDDRRAIHPAMEQGIVSVAKGGITAFMNARASVLAAANPKNGRYNPYKNVGDNIDLPVTILSRFDLIFLLRDEFNAEKDRAIAKHVFSVHAGTLPDALIGEGLLAKYLNRCRKLRPKLSKEVEEKLDEFYVAMRSVNAKNGEDAAVSITVRQMESVVRIAEARAKIFMREEVSTEDVLESMQIMKSCLAQVGVDVLTGVQDIDVLETGRPHSLAMKLGDLEGVIGSLEAGEDVVTKDKMYDATVNMFTRQEVDKLLEVLMRDGTVYSPRPNTFRRSSK